MAAATSASTTSHGVSAAGRRSRLDLRLVAAATSVVLAVVAVVAIVGVRRADGGVDRNRLRAARDAVAAVHRLDADVAFAYYRWFAQPSLVSRDATVIVAEATNAGAAAEQAWTRYKEEAVHIDGERALVRAYEEGVTASEAALTALLAGEDIITWGTSAEDLQSRLTVFSQSFPDTRDRLEVSADLGTLYDDAIAEAAADQHRIAHDALVAVVAAVALGILGLGTLGTVVARSSRRRVRELDRVERQLIEDGARSRLDGELQRALELAVDEEATYRIVDEVLRNELPGVTAELLVADSSFAHVNRVTSSNGDQTRACEVSVPGSCPAVRRGHTQVFLSARALDACPQLKLRGNGSGAVCAPFAIGGSTVGVLHTEPILGVTETQVELLELLARKAGERVGVARAFAKSQDQAQTDPLTGLLNRRSLEERTRPAIDTGRPYVAIFADLDHFKMLNDVHSHDAGDRALRLFSRCLREAVRPSDAVARYGGEEFVLVLLDADLDGAAAVIERVRTSLAHALDGGTVPRFTASFGVAATESEPLAEAIVKADEALLAAKQAGRDRTVVWSSESVAEYI